MTSSSPIIEFHHWDEFPWRGDARQRLIELIRQHKCTDILEVGSGANPTLTTDDLSELAVRYVTNDESAEELEKAPAGFETLCHDLSEEPISDGQSFDLIFSKMVNEHVKDGENYYRNIFDALRPGGLTVHLFSTLYAFPYVVNSYAPDVLSDKLLGFFHPWNEDEHHHKFRAYYSWSRGPSSKAIRGFEELGYEVLEYHGYFGHGYYANRLKPLDKIEQAKSRVLAKFPVPQLTAYGQVVLRKPLND